MLYDVFSRKPEVIPETRILDEVLPIVGLTLPDPDNASRAWTIQGVYAPIEGRRIGGLRIKLRDLKNFTTFCNQRDLEVLLGLAKPGAYCPWSGGDYLTPNDLGWCGFCCDDEDLEDDLFEREILLRGGNAAVPLTPNIEFIRRVHLDRSHDAEELWVLIGDIDMETGVYPDTRLRTIQRRWSRAERKRVRWDRV